MGNSLDAGGKPVYARTPTQTVADLQAAVDYAERVGGLLKVTSQQRGQLTSGQTKPGWLISETDTGDIYRVTPAAPQGVVLPAARTVFGHAGKTGGFQSMSGGQIATIDMQDSDGGFQVSENALVVPVAGRYQVTTQFYFSGAGGGTIFGVLQVNGANRTNTSVYKETGQDVVACTSRILPLAAGDKLRLWSNYGNSTWGTDGYNGLFVEALRVA